MTCGQASPVLFVLDSLDMGGGERAALALAGALDEAGWQVHVAASAGGVLGNTARELNLTVHILGKDVVKRRACDRFVSELADVVAAVQPAVVHTHMFASTVAAAAALGDSATPLVIHEHSMADWRTPRDEALIASAYARADAVIAVSDAIAQRLVTVDRVRPSVVHVLPNPLPGDLGTGRSGAPLPAGHPLVGVVARLVPEKGIEHFVRAAARVQARRPDARFVVVGDGPLRDELEHLSAELGVGAIFLGCRTDGPQLIAGLDVLAIPSLSEGTPLAVLEAARGRTPLVASHVGGIPEQVRDRHEALLVPPGDDATLADAILELLDDQVLARQLAGAAAQRLAAGPTMAGTAQRVAAIYAHCLPAAGVHDRRVG